MTSPAIAHQVLQIDGRPLVTFAKPEDAEKWIQGRGPRKSRYRVEPCTVWPDIDTYVRVMHPEDSVRYGVAP